MKKFSLTCAAAFCVALPAFADPSPEDLKKAEDLFNQAERLYKAGDFQKALDNYKQAYFITEFPDFLFNMAQCQKQLESYDAAIDLYRSYLRDVPDSPLRADVEKTIKELEEIAKKQKEQKKPASSLNFKEIAPTFIVPAATFGTWVIFGVTARQIHNRIENTATASPAFYNTGRAFAIASDASIVAFGVTTYLAINKLKNKDKEKSVSLTPIPQGAAVLFTFTPEVTP